MEDKLKLNLNKVHCLGHNNLHNKLGLFLEDKHNLNKDPHYLEANKLQAHLYSVDNNQLSKQDHYSDNHNKHKALYLEVNNQLKQEVFLVVRQPNNLNKDHYSEVSNQPKQEDLYLVNNSQLRVHCLANPNNKQVLYSELNNLNSKVHYLEPLNKLKQVDLYLEVKLQEDYSEGHLNKALQVDHYSEVNKEVHYSEQQVNNKVSHKQVDFLEVHQLLDSANNLKEIYSVVKICKQLHMPII